MQTAVGEVLVTAAVAACSPTGHLEVFNRLEEPISVVIDGHLYPVEACGHLVLQGVPLVGLALARPDGSPYAVFDPNGVAEPLAGARYIVENSEGSDLDLRIRPATLPPCKGRIGEPLSGMLPLLA